jgi:hypothetical protein
VTERPAVALIVGVFVLATTAAAEDSLALVGGTIYVSPSDEPIRDGVVLVRGGEITAVGRRGTVTIPPDAQRIDCFGLAVAAGFWNSHVHFFERKWANAAEIPAGELARQLREMLTRWGFTSVFDLGSIRENTMRIRDRVESGEVPGPRIRSTGDALLPPGIVPSEEILRVLGFMANPFPGVADASQAAAAAKGLLDKGVDGLKLHSLSDESVIRAAVAEGRRAGKPRGLPGKSHEGPSGPRRRAVRPPRRQGPLPRVAHEVLDLIEDQPGAVCPVALLTSTEPGRGAFLSGRRSPA